MVTWDPKNQLNLIALMRIRHFNEFRPNQLHWVCPNCQKHISVTLLADTLYTSETLLEAEIEYHEMLKHDIGRSATARLDIVPLEFRRDF